MDQPAPGNDFQSGFVARVVEAFARITGGDLVAEAGLDPADLGRSVWEGNFALLTHDTNAILTYGNRFALDLWEMDWEMLTRTPSCETAPEEDRAARALIMAEVERNGFTRAYGGRRVSRSGRLFRIENATVFTLIDEKGAGFGTGAFFRSVHPL
ncbi:MAG: MEKHLA domain-containing protein [Alphaproteobacteria bacterium]|nr:MEKHLA domain-containing protein [Alphaproteobacteria bacterium]